MQIYEALDPLLSAGEVELLDVGRLQEQLLGKRWTVQGGGKRRLAMKNSDAAAHSGNLSVPSAGAAAGER